MNNILIANSCFKKNTTQNEPIESSMGNVWSKSQTLVCEKLGENVSNLSFFLMQNINLTDYEMSNGVTFYNDVNDLTSKTVGYRYLIPFIVLRSNCQIVLDSNTYLGIRATFKNSNDEQSYQMTFRYTAKSPEILSSNDTDTWITFNPDKCVMIVNKNTSTEFECTIKPFSTSALEPIVNATFSANDINSICPMVLHSPTYNLISLKNCGSSCRLSMFLENGGSVRPALAWGFIGAS